MISHAEAIRPHRRVSGLIAKTNEKYEALLSVKRDEVAEIVRQGMQDVHQLASEARDARDLLCQADDFFAEKRDAI